LLCNLIGKFSGWLHDECLGLTNGWVNKLSQGKQERQCLACSSARFYDQLSTLDKGVVGGLLNQEKLVYSLFREHFLDRRFQVGDSGFFHKRLLCLLFNFHSALASEVSIASLTLELVVTINKVSSVLLGSVLVLVVLIPSAELSEPVLETLALPKKVTVAPRCRVHVALLRSVPILFVGFVLASLFLLWIEDVTG